MLRWHLASGHELSVEQYRVRWNLPVIDIADTAVVVVRPTNRGPVFAETIPFLGEPTRNDYLTADE